MRVKSWLWMIPLLLLIMLLGTQRLDESLWVDEVWSLYYAGGTHYGPLSPTETVGRVIEQYHHERNPPGYYLLLNLWGSVVGWSDTAARFLSLLAGLLAVAWIYRLGREIISPVGGLGAAVTLGMSAFYISYLHEMRVYTIYVLLAVWVLWAYWHLIRREKPRLGVQIAYLLGIVGIFYTYFFNVLVLAGLGLAHLFFVHKNQAWMRVGLLTVLGALTFVPWAGLLLQATSQSITTIPTGALATDTLVNQILIYFSNSSVALFGIVLLASVNLRDWKTRMVWFIVAVVFVLVVLISLQFHIFLHTRYVLVLWPLLALLCGLGIERLARRGIHPIWILGIWTIAGVWSVLYGYQPKMPYSDLTALLQARAQSGDQLAFHAPDWDWLTEFELDHYMHDLPITYSLLERISGLQANNEYGKNALIWLGKAPRVWLAIDRRLQPNFRLHEFERALSRDYQLCGVEYNNPQLEVRLFARDVTTPQIRWSNGVGLSLVEPLKPDRTLTVLTGWRATPNESLDSYSVGLHVLDAGGQLVKQVDFGVPHNRNTCLQHTIPIGDLASGEYTLAVVLYDWRTGERVGGVNREVGEVGDYFTLSSFSLP